MKKLLVALLLGTTLTVTACADSTDTTTTAGTVTTTTAGSVATTTAGASTTTSGASTTTANAGEAQTKEITTTGMSEGLIIRVTATPDTIQSVEIVEHNETEGISDPAIENVPDKIVEENSVAVDVETGATLTSDAILAAVEQALTEMGYDLANFK